jgi:N-acetylmuramoyl-L-alanine amidase
MVKWQKNNYSRHPLSPFHPFTLSPFVNLMTQFYRTLTYFLIATVFLCLTAGPIEAKKPGSNHIAKRYSLSKAYYHHLLFSRKLSSSRDNWLKAARFFNTTYRADPYNKLAPASLLTLGHIYFKMYKRFGKSSDLSDSLGYYDDVFTLFPKHRFADDALYKSGKIMAIEQQDYQSASRAFTKLLGRYSSGDMVRQAAIDLKIVQAKVPKKTKTVAAPVTPRPVKPTGTAVPQLASATLAQVIDLRHWTTKDYTRVVVETSKEVKFKENALEKDGNKPRRLYLNLFNSRINKNLQSAIPIDDGLLQRVRSAQYTKDTVRVVLDTLSLADYTIFSLQDPFRIVIDIKGTEKIESPLASVVLPNAPSLAQQLGLGINKIIIDPGHGGKDPGAIGIYKLREKDIVLKVAKLVARKLNKDIGCEIVLTRNRDKFVRLEERTAIANTKGGDLFISIHANSAPNKKAHGVETYYLSMASTKEEMRVAALENATSTSNISEMQDILKLMQHSKIEESARLANIIQKNMVNGLSKKYTNIGNHGVKKAPFLVLVGAQMPAILTEIAFLSNKKDAKRLKSDKYLNDVANQIAAGIIEYSKVLDMASL